MRDQIQLLGIKKGGGVVRLVVSLLTEHKAVQRYLSRIGTVNFLGCGYTGSVAWSNMESFFCTVSFVSVTPLQA